MSQCSRGVTSTKANGSRVRVWRGRGRERGKEEVVSSYEERSASLFMKEE